MWQKPWMRTHTQTYSGVTAEAVWRLWTDIEGWPAWHDDLDYCTFKGPFEPGNFFMLKPKTMGAVKIALTAVEAGRSFTDCTAFWGAKMYDHHLVEATPEGVRLTNTVEVVGPLAFLWVFLVARNVAATVPAHMAGLARLARAAP